jgi:hypothetical protein
MAYSRRLLNSPKLVRLNDVTVSVANADQSMMRISSIDFTYLIAFVVASGPPYHSRPNGSTAEIRSTRVGLGAGGLRKAARSIRASRLAISRKIKNHASADW